VGLFGKKSKPSTSPASSQPKVEVQGFMLVDGRPVSFKTSVPEGGEWEKDTVTRAAIAEHGINGRDIRTTRWGTVESGRLDYS